MTQKEIGGTREWRSSCFCWRVESRTETTERIEKRPYFPVAGTFFFG